MNNNIKFYIKTALKICYKEYGKEKTIRLLEYIKKDVRLKIYLPHNFLPYVSQNPKLRKKYLDIISHNYYDDIKKINAKLSKKEFMTFDDFKNAVTNLYPIHLNFIIYNEFRFNLLINFNNAYMNEKNK